MDKIKYTKTPDNTREVVEFVGPIPPCPTCDDTGEYEANYGPAGCQACNSRCIPFIGRNGKRLFLDWGDTLVRDESGLWIFRKGDDK